MHITRRGVSLKNQKGTFLFERGIPYYSSEVCLLTNQKGTFPDTKGVHITIGGVCPLTLKGGHFMTVDNLQNHKFRERLKNAKRIVVKVGTSTLTYGTGNINLSRIDKLSMVLSDLVNQGKEVILVTSGAIGVGVGKLKLRERPKTIREKQAVAAVGQCELMHIYSKFF